jgi:glycosyltransferase involved in cell wall biosynthesis
VKILLANYRYFISGGPERYLFNVAEALSEDGHEVVPFSIHYSRNQASQYSQYFVEPLGSRDEVYFQQHKRTFRAIWRTAKRLFYDPSVDDAVTRLIEDSKPEVAYVLHYLRKLSPSLLAGIKHAGLPIVVRLSDYAMLCPQAHFLRDGKPCEACGKNNLWPSVRYRCIQHSLPASGLNFLATNYHRMRRYFDMIDVFVTTTNFMYQKMLQAGYNEQRLCHIPTFVNAHAFHPSENFIKEKYIVYAGRMEKIKGVHFLISAMAALRSARPNLSIALKLAGDGDKEYISSIKQQVEDLGLNDVIQFLGELKADKLSTLMSRAYLSVVPSIWYENLPNTILESYACGTPVLASNLGSLVECVSERQTGLLFQPGDANQLAERLAFCLDRPDLTIEMSHNARKVAETRYSKEQHLRKLESLFKGLAHQKALEEKGSGLKLG